MYLNSLGRQFTGNQPSIWYHAKMIHQARSMRFQRAQLLQRLAVKIACLRRQKQIPSGLKEGKEPE